MFRHILKTKERVLPPERIFCKISHFVRNDNAIVIPIPRSIGVRNLYIRTEHNLFVIGCLKFVIYIYPVRGMAMFKLLIIFILFTLFPGCDRMSNQITDNSASENFNLGDTVSVAYHQTLVNDEENISIRFKELIGDSRCPIDVCCFWQGDAEIQFTINAQDIIKDFNPHTAWLSKQDTTLLDYNIKLIDVKPYKHTEFEYHPKQYEAYLVVSRN